MRPPADVLAWLAAQDHSAAVITHALDVQDGSGEGSTKDSIPNLSSHVLGRCRNNNPYSEYDDKPSSAFMAAEREGASWEPQT